MLEASSQQKQECKPHSFHECAACEGGKVKGAVIQRNCKQEVLILSFPIRPYIQSKQNHFFLQNLILGKSQVIHRYQGMYTVYCFFPDIDFFFHPFMAILLWAAMCCPALYHPGEPDDKRMNSWERNGIRTLECNPVTYSSSNWAVVYRTIQQGWTSSSLFILFLLMTTDWSWA